MIKMKDGGGGRGVMILTDVTIIPSNSTYKYVREALNINLDKQ